MNLKPVEHFFLTGLLCTHSKPVKKWGKKCSTGQMFICTEVTSYKIHILKEVLLSKNNFNFDFIPISNYFVSL